MLRRVDATNLAVRISSTGHVSIRDGVVSGQEINVSSTGSFEALDVDSNVADVRLSSTGSAYITVYEYLEASLDSTDSVHFRGQARTDIRCNSTGRAIMLSQR